jgi:hypothetical protein
MKLPPRVILVLRASLPVPKVIGSRFRVQARPGATGCGYEVIFTFYELGFPTAHLDRQVWARGSKVIKC